MPFSLFSPLTNPSIKKPLLTPFDRNGDGTAGANFDHPTKPTTVKPNTTVFVPLPSSFKGRVQRGKLIPATWVEFQLEASNDHAAHGDISLEQGCDGAATIASTDGSKRSNGFTNDILKDAPAAATVKRADGMKVWLIIAILFRGDRG